MNDIGSQHPQVVPPRQEMAEKDPFTTYHIILCLVIISPRVRKRNSPRCP